MRCVVLFIVIHNLLQNTRTINDDLIMINRPREVLSKIEKSRSTNQEKFLSTIDLGFPSGCDWLWFTGVINSNTGVSPCCFLSSESLDFGQIKNQSFSDVRNNPMYMEARNIITKNSYNSSSKIICERCPCKGIWHTQDWLLEIIIISLLKKLPDSYGKIKNISLNQINWELIKQLKSMILKEIS